MSNPKLKMQARVRWALIASVAAISASTAACRSRDNCYKTYPDGAASPTDAAMNPHDERPKVEPAPTRPTADSLPPPSNPNNVPR